MCLRELDFARGDYPAYIDDARRYASITNAPDDLALANALAAGLGQSRQNRPTGSESHGLKAGVRSRYGARIQARPDVATDGASEGSLPFFRAAMEKHCIELITMANCPWAKALWSNPDYAALFSEIRARTRGGPPTRPEVIAISFRLPQ